MPEPDAVADVALAWFARGDTDLATARALLQHREDVDAWVVSFHAQQAAEKYLKAALVLEQVPFSRTHELELLASSLRTPWSLPDVRTLAGLTRFAVAGRYPEELFDSGIDPTWQEAEEAVGLAEETRQGIVAGFSTRGISDAPHETPADGDVANSA